jgi:hypothetical protein
MYFDNEKEAYEYAHKCPAHTRVVHPPPPDVSVFTESTTPLTAHDFCAEAARLVSGPRATTHGDKITNFSYIAELWNGYWRIKCRVNGERVTTPFDAKDIGNMMELMKIARRFSGTFNAEDYIDAAGYAGCTGEIAAREQETLRGIDSANTSRTGTNTALQQRRAQHNEDTPTSS